ncbi:MAG: 4-(cytidine 5'-diphospho)-2-C-methyl-D-erythritol kinase [Bacteroidaceae bacterium]|nr:4-(cytidine 5'-diphospho)-2-C-methyl-D-erythritol kinase [Bacteroidaceae bacterium]
MKTFPCAKINLGLYITERRPDGYHNLQTVFYPIPLCDELEVYPSADDRFSVCGPALANTGVEVADSQDALFTDNLVMRVIRLLREEPLDVPPVSVRLTKNIPFGAGLGGGSSDAAAMMKMLNTLFGLGLTEEDMEQRLVRLGADCPFFVRQRPVLSTGIGDRFTPIDLDLSGLWILLVKPDEAVSTRKAYQGVTPCQPAFPLSESIARPIREWQQFVSNDFERTVFPHHPGLSTIKQQLIESGAIYAAMSGSGSSLFGLFDHRPDEATLHAFAPNFVFSARL